MSDTTVEVEALRKLLLSVSNDRDSLRARLQEAEALAYVGEHHFPDLTWKARFEETLARAEKAERERDSLRMERDGLEMIRVRDNGYLLAERDAAIRERDEARAGWDTAFKDRNEALDRASAALEALKVAREAIRFFFTPGPGIGMPEFHPAEWEPCHATWNEKLRRLVAVCPESAASLTTPDPAALSTKGEAL